MKLYIFEVWQGYVREEYYPIVSETEEDARKVLKDLVMPKWIEDVNRTAQFIRTEYSKEANLYTYPIRRNYGDYKPKIFKDADEEADDYAVSVIGDREKQVKECSFVFVDLPLVTKGFISELFHCFVE